MKKPKIDTKHARPAPDLVRRLLAAKKRRNISARELSREAGVTQPTVTTLIADPQRPISFHVAAKLEGWVIAQKLTGATAAG